MVQTRSGYMFFSLTLKNTITYICWPKERNASVPIIIHAFAWCPTAHNISNGCNTISLPIKWNFSIEFFIPNHIAAT